MNNFEVAGIQVGAAIGRAFKKVLGWESDDNVTFVPALFDLEQSGGVTFYYKPAGNLVNNDRFVDVIASASPANVVWRLPTMASLGYTPNMGTVAALRFSFQRQGDGFIFVNPIYDFGAVANAAAMTALNVPTAQVGDICHRTDDGGVYELTALPSSTAGNWTKRSGANAPTGAPVISDPDGLNPTQMNKLGAPVTLISCGLDQWFWA